MKQLIFTLRFLLLASILLGATQTATASWKASVKQDGINYIVYLTGEKYNAVIDSVFVGNNQSFNGAVANIAPSVTYNYSWTEFIGYDIYGDPIYETINRPLCAPVTAIIDCGVEFLGGAFDNLQNLISVDIPNTITHIGYMAFNGCANLANVNIPNSVTHIGDGAFGNCGLTGNLIIPNSVTSIDAGAFSGCRKLNSVSISNSLTYIGSDLFQGCSGLTSVSIPNSVISIDEAAFYGCTSLAKIVIPNSLKTIGPQAFSHCSGLKNVVIGNSVKSIGSYAFSDCTSLKDINFSNSVTTIGAYAFQKCSSLDSVCIPNSVTDIEYGAFDGCTGMQYLTIGTSVTNIADYAFRNCNLLELTWNAKNCSSMGLMPKWNIEFVFIGDEVQSLPRNFMSYSKITNVTIPNSVTSIGDYAFSGCNNLTDITCLAINPPSTVYYSFSNYSATLHVPVGSIEVYQTTDPWSNFTNIVGINEPGDVNGDGGINISDVTSLIDLLLSGGEIPVGADVNGDGQVNISDVTALIDRLLSGN